MNGCEFSYVQRLVRDCGAIVLDSDKAYLVESRLGPLVRREGFDSIGGLVAELRTRSLSRLHMEVVEAMTINETLFFRDHHPFELLRLTVLPELIRRRSASRTLNLWSAGCAAGQEPYSIAMLIREHFPELAAWNVRIVACDLSEDMVARSRKGIYGPIEVNRGLPAAYLVKYFRRDGADWRIDDAIRSMVEFRPMNLAGAWPALPDMDLVFLRNVLIYFDGATKKAVLSKVARQLRPAAACCSAAPKPP